jgi:hypothetical protein
VDYAPAPETYYVQTMPSYGVKGKGGRGTEYGSSSGYPVAVNVPVVHPRAAKQGALAGMPPQVTDHQLAVCFNITMSDIAKIGNVQKFGADLGTVVMLGDVGVDPDERSITVTGTLRASLFPRLADFGFCARRRMRESWRRYRRTREMGNLPGERFWHPLALGDAR